MFSLEPRKRGWLYAPLWLGLAGSTATHASILLTFLFGATGLAGASGEDGHSGAGGTTIDVSLAESTPATPGDTAPPSQTAPPQTAPTTEPPTDQSATLPRLPTKSGSVSPAPSSSGTSAETNSGKLAGPARVAFPNVGIDGDSVDGQRALLPAAVSCADAVAGRWEALKYNPLHGMWVHFTLTVRRSSSGTLSGTILSRTWAGNPFDRLPPPCTLGGFDETISMNAFGSANSAGKIDFGANHYTIVSVQCPALDPGYAPDHFSGSIDSAREEFQSLNNDGATDINAPYVFRRTGCLP